MKPRKKTVRSLWPCCRYRLVPRLCFSRDHRTVEGAAQFTGRAENGYTLFGHGIFVFRKKSARVGNPLAISLAGHRIGTSSPRDVLC